MADNRSNRSLSPILIREKKCELPPMSIHYKKTLHDEVVHIMNNLGPSLQFDLSKTFSNQKKTINKKLLPVVKAAMNTSIEAYDVEILKIIKQLHKSRREIYKLQKEGKIEERIKRQHMTSRREQKMSWRKKGLQHLISTKDDILSECHLHNLTWEEFIKDSNAEHSKNARRGRLANTNNNNSVIKIYNKNWRSSRITKILHRAEEIGISIRTGLSRTRYHSDNNVDKKSEPNESMSSWWISSTWAAQESDDDEEEEDNNNDDNNEDNNDDNHDDNHDDNNDDDNNDADNNDGKKDDDCPFHLVVSEEIRSSISSTKKNSLPKKKKLIFHRININNNNIIII
ncbi:unnamed protein product [Rhizophagus irregularis]|nr:unnamed protein product [Rhizophagus irregularis]